MGIATEPTGLVGCHWYMHLLFRCC